MSSINLVKLLSTCKVLQSGTIVPITACGCHNKIDNKESLEIFTNGPEPIFRCFNCGASYCAASYMLKILGMADTQVIDKLIECGFSIRETNYMIKRGIKYLEFLSKFESGRHDYREKVQLDERRVKSYGDWSQISGETLNSLFFRRSISKLNTSLDYSILMTRDENGIPSKCLIYTLLGSYIGEVKVPIPSGKISILADRWTDFVQWTNKIILTDSSFLASSISKSLVDTQGLISFPVGVMLGSESVATFFSKIPPKIEVVLGADEKSYKFACLSEASTDVYIYRLTQSDSGLFSITKSFDDEISRINPVDIVHDIVYELKLSNKHEIKSFCSELLKMHNCSDYFRNKLIDFYCLETNTEKKKINEAIAIFGTSINSFSAANKKFKIHNSCYNEVLQDWSMKPISNFWININAALCSEEGNIEYDCTLFIGDKEARFFIQHSDFFQSKKLFKIINFVCVKNSLEQAYINSNKLVMQASPYIIRGLNSSKINTIKKETYGISNETLVTETFKCDKTGLSVCNNVIGEKNINIRNPINLNNTKEYNKLCKKQIKELCSSTFGSEVFVASLQFIYSLIKNDVSHIVSNRNIVRGISEVLGVSTVNSLVKSKMPQIIEKILNPKNLNKNCCTISLIDNDQKYTKKVIALKTDTPPQILNITEPMLLFIFKFCVDNLNSNYIKNIENFLSTADQIYNLRKALAKIYNTNQCLESFAWYVTEDVNLSKFIETDDHGTNIYIKIFSELSEMGYDFKKSEIIKLLKINRNKVTYPLIDLKDRRVFMRVEFPNPIQDKINSKNNIWKTTKTRHISMN
jgi:hypothetical protein